MNDFIACCDLDCEACEARIATVNNDNELRRLSGIEGLRKACDNYKKQS